MTNETVLSKMVKDFGDEVMRIVTGDLYSSGLAHFVIFVFGVLAVGNLGLALHRREAPTKGLMFFAAWLACFPVAGKPLAYGIVNGLSTSLAYQLEKSTIKILGGMDGRRGMPPGWVMNALMRGAMSEITDVGVKDDVLSVMENCVPNVANNNGDPLTVADLFGGQITQNGGSETYQERFDPVFLKNRKVRRGGSDVNCYDLLVSTRSHLRSHLAAKNLTKMPAGANYGPSSGELSSTSSWAEPTSDAAAKLRQTSLNLATAIALQKVAAGIDPDRAAPYLPVSRAIELHTNADIAAHPSGGANIITEITFDIMSAPSAIARSLNLDGTISSGIALYDMNEKLTDLPYYLATLQSILKILAPIAIMTMMFGTFKFFASWSLAWVLTVVMPVVMHLSRGMSNMLIIHANKLVDSAGVLAKEPGFMAMGIDFSAANQIVYDSSRMMNVILHVELGVWVVLLLMVPAGGWFAGSHMKKFMMFASGVAFGRALRRGDEKKQKSGSQGASGQDGKDGPDGNGGGNAAPGRGQGVSSSRPAVSSLGSREASFVGRRLEDDGITVPKKMNKHMQPKFADLPASTVEGQGSEA